MRIAPLVVVVLFPACTAINFLTYLYKLFDSSKPHVIIDNKFFYVPLMLNDVVHAGSHMQTRPFALLSK